MDVGGRFRLVYACPPVLLGLGALNLTRGDHGASLFDYEGIGEISERTNGAHRPRRRYYYGFRLANAGERASLVAHY